MSGLLDIDRLHSVGVVVKDLEKATLRYAEIFGIDAWDVREFGPARLTDVSVHGRRTIPAFRTATGTTVPPAGVGLFGLPNTPVTFELVQPLRGESPFQEFRFVRGQGISHLTLAVRDSGAFGALRELLAKNGIPVAASMTVDGALQRHFLDTRAALGGFLIEVQVPLRPSAEQQVEVTERWNHAGRYTRPEGVGPIAVQGVNHFGVVVNDVMASLRRYNEILGIPSFQIRDWRTEPDLLEGCYYRGEPVEHEYFTGVSLFHDFGFEIIQPTIGPSHYNREFRDRWGEGVHHMLLNATTDEGEWDRSREWLASIDVPLVMGADVMRGSSAFCYYDTTEALGGYILEAVLARRAPDEDVAQPDYVIDFAALTSNL
ncbi:VOC family protein [Streptomyces sp. NPDC004542]|uniref:VOC family protein n=1 Tax=Streptomyces sp. NPDC004542 TaxID=3154281 RepID=UPI0033AFE7EA